MSSEVLSEMKICIPTTYTSKEFTTYNILVNYNGNSWLVPLRYSVMDAFRRKLEEQHPNKNYPPFPKKRYFSFLPQEVLIEERRVALEKWFQLIIDNSSLHSKDFLKFIDPERKSKEIQTSPKIISPELGIDFFILPSLGGELHIPEEIILFNGETCNIEKMISTITKNVTYLGSLKSKLVNQALNFQLGALEHQRKKMDTTCLQLETYIDLITTQLLQSESVRLHYHTLVKWLQKACQVMQMAVYWAYTVEDKLTGGVIDSASPSSCSPTASDNEEREEEEEEEEEKEKEKEARQHARILRKQKRAKRRAKRVRAQTYKPNS